MSKITPFLWFDGKAQEAARFYTSVFKDSELESVSEMSATFRLDDQRFIAFNGGPMFSFSPAVSFFVRRETQPGIDELWDALSVGGEQQRCGWLKDRYGISWQIIPPLLGELLNDEDDAKAQRVLAAMLQMTKIEIEGLTRAAMS